MPQLLPNARIHSRTGRILEAPAPLRLWHLASFDAPTVALVWSLAFAWVAHVRLPLWVPILLALSVWAIYIADRLLDAHSALRNATLHRLHERHFFHWHHRRTLLPLAVVSAAAAAGIVFTLMPPIARERDSLLAAASLVYFTGVHTGRKKTPFLSKELLVGLLFTAGCALPALTRISSGTAFPTTTQLWPLLIPVVFFALLAWLNCYAIDRWESHPNTNLRQPILLLASLLAIATLLVAASLHAQPRTAALLIAGSAATLLLALLDRLRSRFTPVALRAAADLVLLTPLLLIPIAPLFK